MIGQFFLVLQSVTPNLSMGTEIFWLGQQRKSGIGFNSRYNTDKMVRNLCSLFCLDGT